MRNKIDAQKRQHRERGQLVGRQRLGLLEKHGDYVKRARDYHSKEDRIKKLREKAATRNKDEFYFGMIRSKTQNGIHIQDRGNSAMPVDVVKLLKTQDAGYVRTLVSTEEKLIERLKTDLGATVGLLDDEEEDVPVDSDEEDDRGEGTSKAGILKLLEAAGAPQGKKTVFFDSNVPLAKVNPKKIVPSLRKGKGKATARDEENEDAAQLRKERKERLEALSEELKARLERLALLKRTFREMQVQRAIMGNGSKNVIGDRKSGLGAEDERLNEQDLDELELKQLKGRKKKLPAPEQGIRTGARVWKWKFERRR